MPGRESIGRVEMHVQSRSYLPGFAGHLQLCIVIVGYEGKARASVPCFCARYFDRVAGEQGVPPDSERASQVLADSLRHGEWVDIDLPGDGATIKTSVAYPERKDNAPVLDCNL